MVDPFEDEDGDDTEEDAASAFSLLGDPLRLEIIRVLFEAGRGTPVPFSELYDAVDVENTGRFNYHRDELVPQYVRKVDGGYLLTEAGERVARAVNAGTYTGSVEMDDFGVPGACYECGAADLRGEYVGERFRIDCRACENRVLNVGVPPSVGRNRSPEAFVDAVQSWARYQTEQARDGICPVCGGPMEPGLSDPIRETLDYELQAVFDCTVCDRRIVSNFGLLAFWHEDVERFLRERDPELADRPYWAVEQAMAGEGVEFHSRDPVRADVSFHAGGDTCRVEFDDDNAVAEVTVDAGTDDR